MTINEKTRLTGVLKIVSVIFIGFSVLSALNGYGAPETLIMTIPLCLASLKALSDTRHRIRPVPITIACMLTILDVCMAVSGQIYMTFPRWMFDLCVIVICLSIRKDNYHDRTFKKA